MTDKILIEEFDKLIKMRTGTDGNVYLYGVPEHLKKKRTSGDKLIEAERLDKKNGRFRS